MPTLAYGEFTTDSDTLPQVARDYLLQYGFAKSLQDAVGDNRRKARLAWQEAKNGEPEALAYMAENNGADYPTAESFADAMGNKAMANRYKKIVTGTVGVQTRGPRTSPEESMMRTIAVERLAAALKTAGRMLPTRGRTIIIGERELTREDLIEAYVGKHESDLRAEAEMRLEGLQSVNLEELV